MEIFISAVSESFAGYFRCNLKDKTAMKNKEKIKLDVDTFANRLLKIISNWKELYYDKHVRGGICYTIIIKENGNEKKYTLQNAYPKNFGDFEMLMEEYHLW